MREVSETLVRHLHALVRELELTDQEWAAVMSFLKSCGDMSDDSRQEFILLSDTLGVSSMVDLVNHTTDDPRATAPTILGPFYVPDSPMALVRRVHARVRRRRRACGHAGSACCPWQATPWREPCSTCGRTPLTGATRSSSPRSRDRRTFEVATPPATDGNFEIRLVRPVPYPIPADGPVGTFLRSTGRHPMRAAHVHVKVWPTGACP